MAKRVKWRKEKFFSSIWWEAKLGGGNYLSVNEMEYGFFTDLCFCRNRRFTTLKAAQRYCIREAKKIHKVVGTQLDQLEKEAK